MELRTLAVATLLASCAGTPSAGTPGAGSAGRSATVRLVVTDAQTDQPVSARVGFWVDGQPVDPVPFRGSLGWRTRRQDFLDGGGERYVYVGGDAELALPPGRVRLVVRRGHAFAPVERELPLAAGQTRRVEVALSRWSDRRERGWRCGDMHLHLARLHAARDGALRELLDAEDLDLAALVDWAGRADGAFAAGWGGWEWRPPHLTDGASVNDRLVFAAQGWGRHDRACVLALFGHDTPVEGRSRHSPPAIIERVVAEGGIATGTMGEVPIDGALLGRVAAAEVLSHGQMDHLETWYALLGVGARLAAVAGSDVQSASSPQTVVDYHSPPGASRVCVLVGSGPPERERFLEAIAAGRTFVTSGPTLELEVEGEPPGATVARDSPSSVRIEVRLRSPIVPGGRLRLIRNGEVVHERAADARELDVSFDLDLDESAWIAARLDGETRIPGGDVAVAHTSPVYVRVAGRPVFVEEAYEAVRDRLVDEEAIRESGASTAEEREVALRWTREARALLEARRRAADEATPP